MSQHIQLALPLPAPPSSPQPLNFSNEQTSNSPGSRPPRPHGTPRPPRSIRAPSPDPSQFPLIPLPIPMPRIRTPRRPTIFDPDYGNDSDTSSIASLTRALNFISDLDQTARLARDVEDEDEEDSEELDRETEGGSCDCESGYNSEDEVNMNVQNVHEPVALWSNWRQLRDVHFPENITSASFFDEASDIDLDEYDFYSDEEDEDGVWTALENGWSAQVPGIGVHMNVFLQFGNLVIQMVTENGSLYEMEYGALMDPSFDSPVGSVAGRFGRGRRPENVATVAPGAPAV